MGGERGAPLEAVLEEGSDVREASDVNRCSDGEGSTESHRDSNVCAAGGGGVNRCSDGGGGTGSCRDSNVGASGGGAGTQESRASMWSRGIKSRKDAADSRLRKGREWISEVMSSRVARDLVAKSEVLRERREKLIAFQRSKEEARKSRASDWMSAHVKLDREWSSPWDKVMGALPVGEVSLPSGVGGAVGATVGLDLAGGGADAAVVGVGYSALCRVYSLLELC